MRIPASAALIASAVLMIIPLAGCMGPQGNPNRQPYAADPGGVMAVKSATVGAVAYDPYGTPAPFADMQVGQPAINPPPPLPIIVPNQPPRSR